jgi:hypothetical protein
MSCLDFESSRRFRRGYVTKRSDPNTQDGVGVGRDTGKVVGLAVARDFDMLVVQRNDFIAVAGQSRCQAIVDDGREGDLFARHMLRVSTRMIGVDPGLHQPANQSKCSGSTTEVDYALAARFGDIQHGDRMELFAIAGREICFRKRSTARQ